MNIDTKKKRDELKAHFNTGDIPTEQHFAELIDGMINQRDDGLVKQAGNPLALEAAGDTDRQILHLYKSFVDANPEWSLRLNPDDAGTPRPGLSIHDATGASRLFVDAETGRIELGVGMDPDVKKELLHVRGDMSVSGLIKQEDWIELANSDLKNSWVWDSGTLTEANGSNWETPAYFKDRMGMVHFKGKIRGGTRTGGTLIFELPVGYRSRKRRIVGVYTNGSSGLAGTLDILPNGRVQCGGNVGAEISLDGTSFRAEQ